MRIDRVVVDTNVLISSLLSKQGPPRRCVDWIRRNALFATSRPILAEAARTVLKPRIARLVDASDVSAVLERLKDEAVVVEPAAIAALCCDPKDDIVLATARAAKADVIVTGDEDLLILDPFDGIRILTPAAFMAAVEAGDG